MLKPPPRPPAGLPLSQQGAELPLIVGLQGLELGADRGFLRLQGLPAALQLRLQGRLRGVGATLSLLFLGEPGQLALLLVRQVLLLYSVPLELVAEALEPRS